jgi:LEA14-like dessication related protein
VRAFILSSFLLALAGCSTFIPRLETPTLSIVNVELLESTLWQQKAKVRLRVQNPNDRALPIKGLSYALEVAGENFANGVSNAGFTVPALGEAEFDMSITANMASTLVKVLGRGGDSFGDQVDYRIKGKISLAEGFLRSIPFEERGTFKLR